MISILYSLLFERGDKRKDINSQIIKLASNTDKMSLNVIVNFFTNRDNVKISPKTHLNVLLFCASTYNGLPTRSRSSSLSNDVKRSISLKDVILLLDR